MVNDNDNFMIVARVAEIGTRVIFENQFMSESSTHCDAIMGQVLSEHPPD